MHKKIGDRPLWNQGLQLVTCPIACRVPSPTWERISCNKQHFPKDWQLKVDLVAWFLEWRSSTHHHPNINTLALTWYLGLQSSPPWYNLFLLTWSLVRLLLGQHCEHLLMSWVGLSSLYMYLYCLCLFSFTVSVLNGEIQKKWGVMSNLYSGSMLSKCTWVSAVTSRPEFTTTAFI